MTNPSYEYMRRIKREEQAKLLDMRRERVVKALDGLNLHGDSHAMLSQIAYSVHPHVGAWDAESCDHLRNVLIELIGEAREAASDAQRHSHCGTGGCHSRNESKEVDGGMAGGGCGMREVGGVGALGRIDYSDVHQGDVGYPLTQYDVLGNERHKAVCELRKLMSGIDDLNSYYQFVGELFDALGVDDCPDDELCWDDRLISLCDRLIHLLGGDQSHDTSSMRQENETGITDEPDDDERYVLDVSEAKLSYEPDSLVITNGRHETRITNNDMLIDGVSVVGALDEVANGRMPDLPTNPITSELREWAKKFEYTWINVVDGTIMYTTANFAPDIDSMKVSDYIIGIADRIDEQFADYQRAVEALALVHRGTLAAYKRLKEKLNE